MKKILISLSVFFIGFSFAANDTSSSISGSVNVPGATITVDTYQLAVLSLQPLMTLVTLTFPV